MEAFYSKMGGRNKVPEAWRPGLKRYAKRAINEYIAKENRTPTVDWVMDIMEQGLVKGVAALL